MNKSGMLILQACTPMSTVPTVPTSHPEIITKNFDEDISNYFELMKCTVLPPRGLFHAVLPHHGQNKLMSALCKMCTDTGNQTPCTHSDTEQSHSRNVVQRRVDESVGERLPHHPDAQSMAFPAKDRYVV